MTPTLQLLAQFAAASLQARRANPDPQQRSNLYVQSWEDARSMLSAMPDGYRIMLDQAEYEYRVQNEHLTIGGG